MGATRWSAAHRERRHALTPLRQKHLSNAGAERIYEAFKADFEWAFAARSGP